MSDRTPEEIADIYAAALQSVELLNKGEPVGYVGDWTPIEQANKAHLQLVLSYDFWTTEDLTPIQDAINNETPRNVVGTTPQFDRVTQKATEGYPLKQNGQWTQTWVITSLTQSEQADAKVALQQEIVDATQKRLDDFAQTREYDGILSACTYHTSPTPKFQAEGAYCVTQRDATWATLYTILAEVEASTRPIPQSFADIEPELPDLVWPT